LSFDGYSGFISLAIFLNVGSIVEPGAGADPVILRVALQNRKCGAASAGDLLFLPPEQPFRRKFRSHGR
jgi:hypothetical protein